MIKQKQIIITLIASFITGIFIGIPASYGQVKEQINVVKPYKPKLSDAIKMGVQPINEDITFEKPELTYQNEASYLPLAPGKDKLPAVSLGKKELDPLRNTFLKAGYGNYSNLFAEFNYNTLRSEDKALAIYAKHHSGKGPLKHSEFGEQIVDVSGKKLFDNTTLEAEGYFKNNVFHNYGYDHEQLSFEKDSLRHRYTRYGLDLSFHNERGDTGQIDYWLNAKARNLETSRKTGETDIHLSGKIRENFNSNAAVFNADYRYLEYRHDGGSYPRSVLKIDGHYVLNHEIGQAKIGFRSATVSDTASSPFHFYPFLRIDIPLEEDKLTAYGGIKGDLQVNTYQSFIDKNPYFQSDLPLQNTNNKFEIFAGVKGHLFNRKASYNANLTYKNVENLPLYINNPADPRTFTVFYDSAVTTIFKLHGEFQYEFNEQFDLFLQANYRRFTLASADAPWHRPTLDYELRARYSFGKKIQIYTSIFGFNQRKALVFGPSGEQKTKELDGILDLNAGVNYRFSRAVSAYFNFNNLLSNEYQYWNNYPVRGFHFMGGLKLNLF